MLRAERFARAAPSGLLGRDPNGPHAQLPSRGPIHAVAAQGHVAETAAGDVLAHVNARSPAGRLLTQRSL